MMAAKRDEHGRLLCKRPGCRELRWSPRECREHASITHAILMDAVQRASPASAPWRQYDAWGRRR